MASTMNNGTDILDAALQGIGHWAVLDQAMVGNVRFTVIGEYDDNGFPVLWPASKHVKLTPGLMTAGARKVCQMYPDGSAARDIRAGNIDADAADLITQVMVLGEGEYA